MKRGYLIFLMKSSQNEATILTFILWHIWEARNGVREGQCQLHPYCVVQKIHAYAEMVLLHLYKSFDSNSCDPASPKRWAPPPEGWVKMNVDVALFAESN
jgi:hypothetical protein